MVSRCAFSRIRLVRLAIAASTAALLALPCAAQSTSQPQFSTIAENNSQPSGAPAQYSSSSDWRASLATYDLAAAPRASASAQYGQYGRRTNNRYPAYQSRWSHLAFEIGAGPTAPIGNAKRDGWETWGYNVTAGVGWNFSKYLGTLFEYQFNRMKIPGSTLTGLAIANGLTTPLGGNINTWSLTVDPILYLPAGQSTGAYITGGGGFYRKVTNFTEPALTTQCDPYYFYCYQGYVPTTVAHSSSNQGGLNIGLGLYWKAFGPDSNAKLYAEARYVWVDSPLASPSDPYGSGTEGFIPVTFGLRF